MKKSIIFFIALIIVIIGTVFIIDQKKYTNFQKIVLEGKDKVYQISIHRETDDGRTEAIVQIEDEEMIKKIIEKFSQMELKKENDFERSVVDKYSIRIYYNTGCCHTHMVAPKTGKSVTINSDGKTVSYKIVNNINLVKVIDNENLHWDVIEE